jgi:hypothetical protein
VQRQVAVPSALKAAIVRLLAGAGALKHFRCPRHGRRRLWITEFGHPFAPRRFIRSPRRRARAACPALRAQAPSRS